MAIDDDETIHVVYSIQDNPNDSREATIIYKSFRRVDKVKDEVKKQVLGKANYHDIGAFHITPDPEGKINIYYNQRTESKDNQKIAWEGKHISFKPDRPAKGIRQPYLVWSKEDSHYSIKTSKGKLLKIFRPDEVGSKEKKK